MANATVSSLDKMLARLNITLVKCLGLADESPVLGMLNKVTSHKPYGRTLYMNMPFKITSGGQFGLGSEAGAIPAGLASTSNEGKITPKKLWAMVMDITHEAMIAMSGGPKKLRTSLEGELGDALETWRKSPCLVGSAAMACLVASMVSLLPVARLRWIDPSRLFLAILFSRILRVTRTPLRAT
jgi:hypothetical protein